MAAHGLNCCFLFFRLSYAEERLRFGLQLWQPISAGTATCAATTGMSRPAKSSTAAAPGTASMLQGCQSADVLHMQVQRLTADRAMLMHNVQVTQRQGADVTACMSECSHDMRGHLVRLR